VRKVPGITDTFSRSLSLFCLRTTKEREARGRGTT
jgi:hypothetical protein